MIIKKLLELDACDLVRSKRYLPTVYETLFAKSAYTDMMTARSCDVINYMFNLYRVLHKKQVILINKTTTIITTATAAAAATTTTTTTTTTNAAAAATTTHSFWYLTKGP